MYAAAILWLTSQRSRIAPATLWVGCRAGTAAGLVVYTVAPLGLSKDATNPWLPGADIDPLMLMAWALMIFAPVRSAVLAHRRDTAADSAPRPVRAHARQAVAAGVLTSLVSALVAAGRGRR